MLSTTSSHINKVKVLTVYAQIPQNTVKVNNINYKFTQNTEKQWCYFGTKFTHKLQSKHGVSLWHQEKHIIQDSNSFLFYFSRFAAIGYYDIEPHYMYMRNLKLAIFSSWRAFCWESLVIIVRIEVQVNKS